MIAQMANNAEPRSGRTKLIDDASKAVGLLVKLTQVNQDKAGESTVLAKEKVASAKGLAFTFTRRGALGIGLTTGWGFALVRLDGPGEAVKFSAPVYFSIHKLSIGLSYGMGGIQSCVLLNSKEMVDSFRQTQGIIGMDNRIVWSQADATAGADEDAPSYSLGWGTLVDVSLAGGLMQIDAHQNTALYGPEGSPNNILDGKVPPPPEFEGLYKVLQTLVEVSSGDDS